jgi:hypothetical protein
MDTLQTGDLVETIIKGTRTTAHLDLCSNLTQHADRVAEVMLRTPGKCVSALRRNGVMVAEDGKGLVIECVSQKFKIDRQFVWLERSDTLGLALRAVRGDGAAPEDVVEQLILRPSGHALLLGVDREFERSIVQSAETDETVAVFLERVAKTALFGLKSLKV